MNNIILSLLRLLHIIVFRSKNNKKKIVKSGNFYRWRQLFGLIILIVTLLLLIFSSEKINSLLYLIFGLIMGGILGFFSISRFKSDSYELRNSAKIFMLISIIAAIYYTFTYGDFSDISPQSKLNGAILLGAFMSGIILPVGYLKHKK